jgi:hypothetical protein
LVFTAHPTFSLSAELRRFWPLLPGNPDQTNAAGSSGAAEGSRTSARSGITLDYEHGLTLETLANVQSALSAP